MPRFPSDTYLEPLVISCISKIFPVKEDFYRIYGLDVKMSRNTYFRAIAGHAITDDTDKDINEAYADLIMHIRADSDTISLLPWGKDAEILEYLISLLDNHSEYILPQLRGVLEVRNLRERAKTFLPE